MPADDVSRPKKGLTSQSGPAGPSKQGGFAIAANSNSALKISVARLVGATRLSSVDFDRIRGRWERTGKTIAWLRDAGTDDGITDPVISPSARSNDLRFVGASSECRRAQRDQNASN